MITSASKRVWHVATSIPPIRPRNILPVIIMLILWISLLRMNVSEANAFVISVVVAEAYLIWRNLSQAAQSLRDIENGKPRMLRWPVAALVVLAGVQLLVGDPLLTQRILTAFCVFFLIIMLIGMLRERDVLDRVAHPGSSVAPGVPRVSLLRINALMAAIVIAINEILIASESLGVWITVMPVFVLFLHGFYWFLVLMVLPHEEEAD